MVVVFVIAIFLSAALLFAVQPMVGRMVLPALGGSPSVWNAVMVFFQVSLLAGYALAHALERFAPTRVRVAVHAAIVLGSLALLPIAVPTGRVDPAGLPVVGLLAALCLGVGLPAVALATMSPLLQAWYASLDLPRREDPYFLYAASNAGSLLGLLGYPLVAEPLWGLSAQRSAWGVGFAALAAVLLLIWVRIARSGAHADPASARGVGATPWRTRLLWLALAAAPSSLLLGVTQHITTDVAAAPLLWAIPLALYLVTFIVAFGVKTGRLLVVLRRVLPVLLVALVVALLIGASHPLLVVIGLHLCAFTAVALACHARLASLRPHVGDLTRFYLFVSLGGVLGGSFNALLAPLLFDWVAEYPLVLAAGGALALGAGRERIASGWRVWPGIVVAVLAVGVLLLPITWDDTLWLALVGVFAFAVYALSRRPLAFGIATAAVLLAPGWLRPSDEIIARERTFFGVHTVLIEREGDTVRHALRHGGTVHGLQTPGDQTPLTYYHPTGPLGETFHALHNRSDLPRVGAIGLGVGSLAGLARPGDRVTFFEIDPEVARLARDPDLFSYLNASPADIDVDIGDGRLRIIGTGPFELIVLDAFTSDAIPVHLLTAEAFDTYRAELAPGGWIAVHISNRHLDLVPVVAATAAKAGLAGRWRHDQPTPIEEAAGKAESTWCVLAESEKDLAPFARGWDPLEPDGRTRAWTDDYSNILATIRLD